MKIIISPAKTMNEETAVKPSSEPVFRKEASELYRFLKKQDEKTLARIWDCNDKIVRENLRRLEKYDLSADTMPALLAYNGLQFKKMRPDTFDKEEWGYVNSHLVILSGLYGYLRPLDGINPYRLMMGADIRLPQGNLYSFWGDKIYKKLIEDDKVILNLAGKEYSDVVTPYLTSDITFIDVSFLSKNKSGNLVNKSTEAKISRGTMVSYLARLKTDDISAVKNYRGYDYSFDASLSTAERYVFVKG